MRKVLLHNIVAVASYCPVPSIANYARIIRFGDGRTNEKNDKVNINTSTINTHVTSNVSSSSSSSSSSSTSSNTGTHVNEKISDVQGNETCSKCFYSSINKNNKRSLFARLLIATRQNTSRYSLSNSFALMTEEEMIELNNQREANANGLDDGVTQLLVSRPSRSIIVGTIYGLWNVAIGLTFFPFIFLGMSVEKSRNSPFGVLGIPFGPIYGLSWATFFMIVTWYAALQHIAISSVNAFVFRPWLFCFARTQVDWPNSKNAKRLNVCDDKSSHMVNNTPQTCDQSKFTGNNSKSNTNNSSIPTISASKNNISEEERIEKGYDNTKHNGNQLFSENATNAQQAGNVTRVYARLTSFLTEMRVWNDLLCRYERVTEAKRKTSYDAINAFLSIDNVIYHHLNWSNELLRDRAMKRMSKRRSVMGDHDGHYSSKNKKKENDDYYALLDVPHDATIREIKAAYNKKVLNVHPDRNPSNPHAAQEFDTLTKAYKVLSNDKLRRKYNVGGVSNVDDVHLQKRNGVIALFGGEELRKLVGNVLSGGFSSRVIDGCDYTPEELAIVTVRMRASCKKELLDEYLVHYKRTEHNMSKSSCEPNTSATASTITDNINNASNFAKHSSTQRQDEIVWNVAMKEKLRLITETGLAKEVLFAIGQEYLRVLKYYDAEFETMEHNNDNSKDNNVNFTSKELQEKREVSEHEKLQESTNNSQVEDKRRVPWPVLVWRRMCYYVTDLRPHRREIRRRRNKVIMGMKSRHIMDDTSTLVDLAWYCAVNELEFNVRCAAFQILYEEKNAKEAQWRRDALEALAELFIHYGQPYKGANRATLDALMSSMHKYQNQKNASQSEYDKAEHSEETVKKSKESEQSTKNLL